MGLFDAFKKNKPSPAAASKTPSATNAAADAIFGRQEVKKPKSEKDIAIETLLAKTSGGRRKEDSGQVNFDKEGLEITMLSCEGTQSGAVYYCQPMFFIALPKAETLVCTRPLGSGETKTQAVRAAAEGLAQIVNSAFDTLYGRDTAEVKNSFDGDEHIYRYPLGTEGFSYSVGMSGRPELGSLFEVIKDDVAAYLGAKKYHWIELTVSSERGSKGSALVEINGAECRPLSSILLRKKTGIFSHEDSCMYSQTVVMVQDEQTYVCRRESYNEAYNAMYKHVRTALPIMGSITGEDTPESVIERVAQAIGDSFAAWEIVTFLPEIYAEMKLGLDFGHKIVMTVGNRRLELHELQISPIRVIRSELENFIEKEKPSEEFSNNVMSLGQRYDAYMMTGDRKFAMQDDFECTAPEGYEIW